MQYLDYLRGLVEGMADYGLVAYIVSLALDFGAVDDRLAFSQCIKTSGLGTVEE